jgi:hypothetical protein
VAISPPPPSVITDSQTLGYDNLGTNSHRAPNQII